MRNALFWARYIQEVFIPQIKTFWDTYEQRFLPAFDNIEQEAEKIANETWERLGECAGPDADPGSMAEAAEDAGIVYYCMATDMLQGVTNLFAVGAHHLFDQQFFFIHRKVILSWDEENDHSLIKRAEAIQRLKSVGIDVESFSAWSTLEELREVANAVKHADGRAVEVLKQLKPDLFRDPSLTNLDLPESSRYVNRPVFQPLFGQDLYVTPDQLRKYIDAIFGFWSEFVALLEEIYQRRP